MPRFDANHQRKPEARPREGRSPADPVVLPAPGAAAAGPDDAADTDEADQPNPQGFEAI
jgi:hypothetical protein